MKVTYLMSLLLSLFACFTCASAAPAINKDTLSIDLNRNVIGQKLILDIRYYCPNKTRSCKEFQTELTPELKQLLISIKPSGLILFSENIVSSEQLLRLNYSLQSFANEIGLAPLFIAVDQEGGRVSRLVNADFPEFSGNMAIGATYLTHQQKFAAQVGSAMGQQLSLLGINLNFAPSVDVDSNPNNPIINVRSFSHNPQTVAALGGAFIDAMQQHNVIGALKHFPGHGDTALDSHVGLPSVNHDRSTIDAIDLLPFKQVIETQKSKGPKRAVSMIMTAHIQYPKLDDTTLQNKHGANIVVPATLSKKILGEVLRGDLKFAGLVISDAMDMAGISQFFDQKTAVKQSFLAGVDIALMPYSIKAQEDVLALKSIVQELAEDASTDPIFSAVLQQSQKRVERVKSLFLLDSILNASLQVRLAAMRKYIDEQPHHGLAKTLAQNSITQLKNNITQEQIDNVTQVLAVMPDKLRCEGLRQALVNAKEWLPAKTPQLYCYSLLSDDLSELVAHFSSKPELMRLNNAEAMTNISAAALRNDGLANLPNAQHSLFLLGDITPNLAFYETKGLEGIEWRARLDNEAQLRNLKQLEQLTQAALWPSVFVAMRSPYVVDNHPSYSAIYATYDYQVDTEAFQSHALDALVEVLFTPNAGRHP